jgi:hypothetical protein
MVSVPRLAAARAYVWIIAVAVPRDAILVKQSAKFVQIRWVFHAMDHAVAVWTEHGKLGSNVVAYDYPLFEG